nr:major facilitator superfamily transporter [Pseudomonas plecoglossicida NB2011]
MPTAFGLRVVVGLFGVLLAVLCAGLNESVTKISLADIRGAMGIGADEGAWLLAVYSAASVSAMAFAPWLATTFSLRRFTLSAVGLFAMLGLLQPFAPNLHSLMLLRILQGFASGALPPMLMSVALRFLPPGIKVYGLACYALTATFGPNLGTPLAGLWTEYVGWQWAFWQIILPSALAMFCVGWGLPQDPLRLERFKQFDWRGVLLGLPAISNIVLGLPLGAGLWAGDAGGVVRGQQPADLRVDPRRLLPVLPAAGIRPANGCAAAADAFHQRHDPAGRPVRLELVQHRQRPGRSHRRWPAGCPRHPAPALSFQPPGGQPGQRPAGRRQRRRPCPASPRPGAGVDLGRPLPGHGLHRRGADLPDSFRAYPGLPAASGGLIRG